MAAVTVERLSKSYGRTAAVNGVSFAVERGEVFALLGPNGAGKTTTVEILEGFRRRDGGSVRVLGVDPEDRGTERWFRERIGVVLQELAVEPFLTVREVLDRNAGYFRDPFAVPQLIEMVDLAGQAGNRVKTLSGGQQRRLDLALGLIGRPELLFLDEPTTGLDPLARRRIWDVVRNLAAAGTAVILTTHYMDEAEALCDRVGIIAGGALVAVGSPASIGGRDASEITVRFRPPPGVGLEDLPVPAVVGRGGDFEVRADDEVAVLHTLTVWAKHRQVRLLGLSVTRATLEDVYLHLTGVAAERVENVA